MFAVLKVIAIVAVFGVDAFVAEGTFVCVAQVGAVFVPA